MTVPASADRPLKIRPEHPSDAAPIEGLLDRAFGPGRFTKSSERVREFATFRPDLSYCALDGGDLVGSVRMWAVRVGATSVVFLGPLAVEAEARKGGVGGQMVELACQAAARAGFPVVLLVGDEPYFQRFGFAAAPAARIRMPSPVDQRRVLVRALTPGGADDLVGDVVAP